MTEVPEHLLRRSRERREALGLGSGGGEGEAPSGESTAAASETAAPSDAPAAPAPAAAAPPPEPEPAAPPPPPPAYVQAAESRSRIPVWAMPVLALLPLWAFVYAGTLDIEEEQATGPLAIGAEVYSNCASCHGGSGGGGVGPQLSGGEVTKTFPNIDDHLAFVQEGSAGIKGQPYGDPNREGGQRVAESGGMPAWADQLSEEEIRAVVLHERVTLSGEELTQEEIDAFMAGGEGSESGTPDDVSAGGDGGGGGTTTTTAEGG